ncbi:MAG: leucine-rich repeat domain-containing protein [Bacteroidales bacterium]|nr:leucine-rich repeat domain-containing protein [Bacteroidales bacterium]
MTTKHIAPILVFCLCVVALQAQNFVAQEQGVKYRCRVIDTQLRQAEVESVELLSDTLADIRFPEWVRYKGVRYALVSARGGALRNNLLVRSLTTGVNMQYMGSRICYGCENLRWISLGTGLKELGRGAFALCYGLDSVSYNAVSCHVDQSNNDVWLGCYNLRRLHLGDSVRTISPSFMLSCSALDCEMKLPQSLRSIGESAFNDCSNLRGKLVLPPRLDSVGGMAFAGMNSIDTLIIQSRLLQIPSVEHRVFYHSINPVDVIVDSQVIALPTFLFSRFYGMRSLQLPNHLEVLPSQMCIYDSNLHQVRLPDSLRIIGRSAFYECGLQHIEVPAQIVMIENYAFAYNKNLTEATIGQSIKFIGDYAFVEDTALRSVTILSPEPPRIFEHTFSEIDLNRVTLTVPRDAAPAYRRDPLWNRFANIKEIQ